MTLRAVILGVLGAMFIAGFGYINDQVLRSTFLVGNHFPIGVFGGLIVLLLAINPLLYRLRRRWRLRPSELAVGIAFTLIACSVPGSSLIRIFLPTLVMPIRYNEIRPGWKRTNVLSYVPDSMMPSGGEYDEKVVDGFFSGLRTSGEMIPVTAPPWGAWEEAFATWVPLLVLMSIAVICMSLIVHRQWSHHERLRYPIVLFTNALTDQDPDRASGPIFRNRLFWGGVVALLCFHAINGSYAWTKGQSIQIPTKFEFNEILQKWPSIGKSLSGVLLVRPRFYPTVVAFAFLMASDISLSLGISQVLFATLEVSLLAAGIAFSDDVMTGGAFKWMRSGSYLGFALVLVYIGRRYYWEVVKQSVTFRRRRGVDASASWALWILVAAGGAMFWILCELGLAWPFAALVILLTLMIFLVMSRVNAECGVFYFQAAWQPMAVLMGLFGAKALGPEAMVIAGMFCTVMVLDPRECLMPFVVNALKMCDDRRVSPSRVGWAGIGVFILALAVALPLVFWLNYNLGVASWDWWSIEWVPAFTFDAAAGAITQLDLAGELEQSVSLSPLQRIAQMDPSREFLWAAGVGVALAVGCSVLRLRFTRWPFHPILFLAWGTWPLCLCSHSFMLGWMIKTAVTKFGGSQAYIRARTLMIGVIAGDLLGGTFFAALSVVYALSTGLDPIPYRILPPM